MKLTTIILAAGQGKRMCSAIPKVLHTIGGKTLLNHIVIAAQQLNSTHIYVVYGHDGERVRDQSSQLNVQWVEQVDQLGTGHAVAQVLPQLSDNSRVLVLVGDIPLINPTTLEKLLKETPSDSVGIVTAITPNPNGLGRILRDLSGKMIGIVEEKDATPIQLQIQEINTGIILAPAKDLRRWLSKITNHNAQNEYYLTDIIAMAVAEEKTIHSVFPDVFYEVQGVNDRSQLAWLERCYQRQQAKKLMLEGVTLLDPDRFDTRGELTIAQDVTIDINVMLEGQISIGTNSLIGPNCLLRNVNIGKNVKILANCVLEDAEIKDNCIIGPFARIRPGTQLEANVHIGNFVEVKKSLVGAESKINHLSYIGDSTIGKQVNIGAGTITCNYDGINKHQTIIGDKVFIGSDTQLVAPVTVGAGATIGAGSTITKDVPEGGVTITQRLDQRILTKSQKPK